jgi:hypothetical protein
MLETIGASAETLLSELLSTCQDTEQIASQLAVRVTSEPLQRLLRDRAASYRAAACVLRARGGVLAIEDEAGLRIDREAELDDIESVWEAIECSALICFRDALDADLPEGLQREVRAWIEEGVSALERLRSLQVA